jgi:HlyD family secretion protein
MAKPKIKRIILLLVLVAAITGGILFYGDSGQGLKNDLLIYGNVDIRQVRLAFHDTGRIMTLYVTEGDPVSAGQLVAELDPARYEASVTHARATVDAQQEILSRLLAGSRPEEIAAAGARVKAAQATFDDARQTYERTRSLAKTQFVSQQKLDNALAAYKSAEASLDAEKQSLALAVKGPRQEDIAAARATLEANRAALELARRELADAKLYAPSEGVIQDRILEPGDMAFPQTPVYTLALTSPLWVRAYVDEPDLGKIAPGMKATVTIDSFPDKQYRGWIGFISPSAEFTPKSVQTEELRSKLVYQVRVFICDPENELRLGMPATVVIPLDQPRESADKKPGDPCGKDSNADRAN